MKKLLAISALALILAVAIGYGVKMSMNNDVQLSELALMNIEALSQVEVCPEEGWIITCGSFNQRCGRCWEMDFTWSGLSWWCSLFNGSPKSYCWC